MTTRSLQSIQILRGIAAILVLVHHTSLDFDYRSVFGEISIGAIGVDIFFPISGMVIYLTALRLQWTEFIIRRIMRVVPMYWLATAAKVVAALIVPTGATAYALDGWHLTASLLFVPAEDAGGRPFPPIALGWTLNFEMYFYFLSAVILATLRFGFGVAVSLAVGGGVAIGRLLPSQHPTALILLHPIALEFVMGVLIGALWKKGVKTPWWVTSAMVAGAIAVIYCFPDVNTFDPLRVLKWGVPAALIVWSMVMLEDTVIVRKFPAGKLLGDASYSIYLTHPLLLPVMTYGFKRTIGVVDGMAFFALFAGALSFGLIVHVLFERRLNRFFASILDAFGNSTRVRCS